jgi:short-subunit dehydrogenase
MRLGDAHVVVTGATRGIGRQLATELAGRCARLTVVGRDRQRLGELAGALGAQAVTADLTDETQVLEVVPKAEAANGEVDVLVNNAGLLVPGSVAMASSADLRRVVLTNLLAPLELSRGVLPGMLERGRGKIVNMSSLAGEMALRNMLPYGATKSALSLATRGLQRELRGTGVGALLVILGSVATEMTVRDSNRDPVTAATNRRFSRLAPLPITKVTPKIIEAIERDRRVLVMPAYGALMPPLRMLPTRMADAVLIGVQRSH